MAKLKLTVACGDYEIVRALSDGTVQADGIELVMLTGMGSRERHWRMARKTEFDVCEINIGGTNFQPASNIWMRGILEEYYGVPHQQCTWVVERSEDFEFTPPKDLRIEMAPPEKRLDVMLAEGEIPAMLSPDIPR